MKKLLVLALLAATVVIVATGCGQKEEAPVVSNDEKTIVSEIDLPELPKEETEVIDAYLEHREDKTSQETAKVLESEGYHLRNEDIGWATKYDDLDNYIKNIYYPVPFLDWKNEIVLVYIDEDGDLRGTDTEWYGNIHTQKDGVLLKASPEERWIYTNNYIEKWSFGEKKETIEVPEGAIYCGYSFWEGYIFRAGTDVYSYKESEEETPKLVCIAHNVAKVIDSDYYLSSDPWSQPLFLMTDGSIKAYVGWDGNQVEADDIDHLTEIQNEGGDNRVYRPFETK